MENSKNPFYKQWWFNVVIIIFFILCVIGAIINGKMETVESNKMDTLNENNNVISENTESVTAEVEELENEDEYPAKLEPLSGTGDTATKTFTLNSGFVIVDATHDGKGAFVLTLYDHEANPIDLVTTEIGNYDGKKLLFVDKGEYLFNVKADGNWTIQMSQELPNDGIISDGYAEGKGDNVIFMKLNEGAAVFNLTHDGEGAFVVQGNKRLLVTNIGSYSGSQIQKISKTDIYGFDITADGNWTITVE